MDQFKGFKAPKWLELHWEGTGVVAGHTFDIKT
jgi:hypothetical protein